MKTVLPPQELLAPQSGSPRFAGIVLLLLAPVVMLGVLGAWSVRQEQRVAESDAAARALAHAQEAVSRLRADLHKTLWDSSDAAERSLIVDGNGNLIDPPPLDPLEPRHSFPLEEELSSEQLALWNTGLHAESADPAEALLALERFLETAPPLSYVGVAWLTVGLLHKRQNEFPEALEAFNNVARLGADARTATGLPASQAAALHSVQLEAQIGDSTTIEEKIKRLAGEFLARPHFLTPRFLAALAQVSPRDSAVEEWLETWRFQSDRRMLFHQLSQADLPKLQAPFLGQAPASGESPVPRQQVPSALWCEIDAEFLLGLVRSAAPTDSQQPILQPDERLEIRLIPESTVRAAVTRLLQPSRAALPGYLDLTTSISGRQLNDPPEAAPLAAAASAEWIDGASEPLQARVWLSDPERLQAGQRRRTLWFLALIALAGAAAFIGLAATRRALTRQVQLNALKSNFVSSVSHELRAPIASVRLLAESLDEGRVTDPDRQKSYFRWIAQECRRLSGMIQNVLNFSRMERGQAVYEFAPADLAALLSETVCGLQSYAHEKGVSLRLAPWPALAFQAPADPPSSEDAPSPLEVVIDAASIQQALINLVDNAIKFSPPNSEVEIRLSLLGRPPPEENQIDAFEITVRDHGHGIPGGEQELVFQRFYRRGSELRREAQGIGIGLSIVRHVAEGHGGRAWVEGAPGGGSLFIMRIPQPPKPEIQ